MQIFGVVYFQTSSLTISFVCSCFVYQKLKHCKHGVYFVELVINHNLGPPIYFILVLPRLTKHVVGRFFCVHKMVL